MILYDKIYEAVSKGIQKALILPDEINSDISVRFTHKKISNEYSHQKNVDNAVSQLIKKPSIETYDSLMYQLDNGNGFIMYKAKNFKEIETLYTIIHTIMKDKGKPVMDDPKRINLNWIDTSDIMTLVLKDGRDIPCHEYNDDTDIVRFIHLKNTKCPHDLYWSVIYQIFDKCPVCTYKYEFQIRPNDWDDQYLITQKESKKDFNGFEHTYIEPNMKADNKYIHSPYDYVSAMKDPDYIAYVPAIGELNILMEIKKYVNCMCYSFGIKNKYLTKSYNNDFIARINMSGKIISSSFFNYSTSWYVDQTNITRKKQKYYNLWTFGFQLVPLFKKAD